MLKPSIESVLVVKEPLSRTMGGRLVVVVGPLPPPLTPPPGEAVVVVVVGGETPTPPPGPTVKVIPSVVNGDVITEGRLMGVELMSTPPGPMMMVSLLLTVMVEVPEPIINVEPPTTISVTEDAVEVDDVEVVELEDPPPLLEPPPLLGPPPLPAPTVKVIPSVVKGLVITEGRLMGVELISTPLGPMTMVSLLKVMVDVPDPITKVEPPISISVTEEVLVGLELDPPDPPDPPDKPALVVVGGGGSSSVMVKPSVVMTVWLMPEGRVMVLDPMPIPLGPMTRVSLPTVTVDWAVPMSKVLPPMTMSVTD